MDDMTVAMMGAVIKDAMKAAKVPAVMQERVIQQVTKFETHRGQVQVIRTEADLVVVHVSGKFRKETFGPVSFHFPPNADRFLDEFKRAQNEDRSVSVAFKKIGDMKEISAVYVMSGANDPGSNKRKD